MASRKPQHIDVLRKRLTAILADYPKTHIVFEDLNEVPFKTSGYFRPSGVQVVRLMRGWYDATGRFYDRSLHNQTFVATGGPIVQERLVDLLLAELVPEGHLLVDFTAVTEHEGGDWEYSQPGYDYTDLSEPQLLGHNLTDSELARLYFQIEALGSLGESNVYRDLDRSIEEVAAPAAEAARARQAAEPLPLSFVDEN